MTRSLALGGLLAAALFAGSASDAKAQFVGYPYGGYGGGFSQSFYSRSYVNPGFGYARPYNVYPYTPVFGGYRGYYPNTGFGYGGFNRGYGYGNYGGYNGFNRGFGRTGFSFGFSSFR